MDRHWWAEFFGLHWGDLASVVSLLVASLTLWFAKRARDAAEDVRSLAKRRSLAEELRELQTKNHQVGMFLRESKWELVHLRTQEILSACSTIPERWREELNQQSMENVIRAKELIRSISTVSARAARNPPQERDMRQVERAQQRAQELLSAELGASLNAVEREV